MGIPLEDALQASQLAEAKLRAREERLQMSLDAANVGTWDWNIRTGEVRWSENLERIHGQEPGVFRGTFEGFLDGVHPDDRQRVLGAIQNAVVARETYQVEYRSLRSDGTAMWLEGRGRVSGEAGEPAWMSGICMDTTERHQLQDQLRQTQRLESLGVLAGGIAHDFNNLLTGILGNASLADAKLRPDDPARPFLRDVVAASQRAAELTQQLLAYAGKGRVCREHLDLCELVRELMPLVRPSIPAGVQLLLDLAPTPIKADAGQIHQLVMNLIINAAEAISNTGTVVLTTGIEEVSSGVAHRLAPGKYACLRVCDTGAGMDEGTLGRIFEPFFSTKFSGRGLGLAAALGIVHAHHGSITVESAPGKGTTFRVWLPASDVVPAAVQRPVAPADLSGSGVILVVDDEDLVLRMAQASLEAYGYTALLASDGRSALDVVAVSGDRIRAVVLDLTMPGMTSEETIKHLRAMQPTIPVMITSGYSGSEILQRFETTGINGFLQKPYTAEQIARCISAALTR
jgi:PAS domain S-box-containing protein